MAEIKPGQWVNVTVKAAPKSDGGRKTLVKILERDPEIRRERTRMARSRVVGHHQRGGRQWADRPPRLTAIQIKPGLTQRVFASLDVLRDLKCIEQYVELTPAK